MSPFIVARFLGNMSLPKTLKFRVRRQFWDITSNYTLCRYKINWIRREMKNFFCDTTLIEPVKKKTKKRESLLRCWTHIMYLCLPRPCKGRILCRPPPLLLWGDLRLLWFRGCFFLWRTTRSTQSALQLERISPIHISLSL